MSSRTKPPVAISGPLADKLRDSGLREIARKRARGERLQQDDGLTCFETTDLCALGQLALAVQKHRHGNRAFFIANHRHAEHHYCNLFEDILFSGDVGGVRIPGYPYRRVPMPPPELHIERWHESIARLRREKFARIAPTHFGIFDDPQWQLDEVEKSLDTASRWLEETMPSDPSIDQMRQSYTDWIEGEGDAMGLDEDVVRAYELANPLGMSADGLLRYWKKVRGKG